MKWLIDICCPYTHNWGRGCKQNIPPTGDYRTSQGMEIIAQIPRKQIRRRKRRRRKNKENHEKLRKLKNTKEKTMKN